MQISLRNQDFLIDTLELKDKLQILNSSFTNPKILKVIHGSENDILWLQRDFGLYIVNLFDTGQASRALEFQSYSLAYLLKFFCNVEANKKYQTSDWRIRPLPIEMIKYAREDTHYLLYIFDRLKNLLLEKGEDKLKLVLEKSREICLSRYEKEIYTETSFLSLVSNKSDPIYLNDKQLKVFKELFKWRDEVARSEDESVRYVLPNHMLREISESLPTTVKDLISICNPVPSLLRRDRVKLINLMNKILNRENIEEKDEEEGKKIEEISNTFLKNLNNENFNNNIEEEDNNLTDEKFYETLGWVSTSKKLENIDEEKINSTFDFKIKDIKKQSNSLFQFGNENKTKENNFNINNLFKEDKIINFGIKNYSYNKTEEEEKKKEDEINKINENKKNENEIDFDEDEIPKSLNDIYKMSKLNKQKVKKKNETNDKDTLNENDLKSELNIEYNVDNLKPIDFM
jgi:exosome complex exonuclease RRP6